MIRLGINGFGRIGRAAFRRALEMNDIEVVAINDISSASVLAHLLKYDSVFRTLSHEVSCEGECIVVDTKRIPVFAQKDPAAIPWHRAHVDVVLECSGRFTGLAEANAHLKGGAKAVVISAPSDTAPTYLMGVNHGEYQEETVINNASCTTNSVAPLVAILQEALSVQKAMMTTVHSMTAEQNVIDAVPPPLHLDLRRARAASVNITPTTTGAAMATTKVLQGIDRLFDGIAIRVPTLDVSLTDLTAVVGKSTTVSEVNDIFKQAAASTRWKGIVGVSEAPLVSSDFIGSTYSAIVDLPMTRVVDGDLVKIMAWYDNEWGYAARLVELAEDVGKKIK